MRSRAGACESVSAPSTRAASHAPLTRRARVHSFAGPEECGELLRMSFSPSWTRPGRFSFRWLRKVRAGPNTQLAPHAHFAHRARRSRPPFGARAPRSASIRNAAQARVLTPARDPRVRRSKTLQSRRPVLRSSRWRCFYILGSLLGGQGRKSGVSRRDADPCLWAVSPMAPSGSHGPLLFARRPPDPILFRKFALQTFRII